MSAIAQQFQPSFGAAYRAPNAGARFGEDNPRQFNSSVPTDADPKTGDLNARGKKLNGLQAWCLKAIRWYRKSDFIHQTLYKPRHLNIFKWKVQVWGGVQCPYRSNKTSELSCSEYGEQAFREKGVFKGSMLTLGRILTCNPWTSKPESKIGQRFAKVA